MISYYHVAPAGYRGDILKNGLVPDPESERPGVYAWTGLPVARRCVSEFERIREVPHDIWLILATSEWPADDEAPGAVVSAGPVPPAAVSLRETAGMTKRVRFG